MRLYRVASGADPLIGSAKSKATGRWHVNLAGAAAPGDYYARTPSIATGSSGSVCKAATSVLTHVS